MRWRHRIQRAIHDRASRLLDRGATAVEYSLLVAFFALVVIGAVETLQDSAGDRLEQHAAHAGAPSEHNGHFGPREVIAPSPGDSDPTPEPPPVGISSVTLGGGKSQTHNNNKWDATATVTVKDAAGDPLAGANVELVWSGAASGSTGMVQTDSSGTISAVVTNINHNKTITFTVQSVELEGHTFGTPLPHLTLSSTD